MTSRSELQAELLHHEYETAILPIGTLGLWTKPSEQNDEPLVHCPVCWQPWTHLRGVEYRASLGEPVTVQFSHGEDDPNVHVDVQAGARLSGYGPVKPSRRRGSLMVVFECEAGCRFGLSFEQHKGNEFVHLVELDDAP